jgi:integrase
VNNSITNFWKCLEVIIYYLCLTVTYMKISTPPRRRKGNSSMQLSKKKNRKERKVAREVDEKYIDQLLKATSGRAYRVIRIMRECGMHPAVMVDPAGHDLENDKGQLLWHRPKTGALCVWEWQKEAFPPDVLNDFLSKDLGFSRKTYWGDVSGAARVAGLKNISPLTLRHTGVHIRLNRGERAAEVQKIWRMSTEVLWGAYAEFRDIRFTEGNQQ